MVEENIVIMSILEEMKKEADLKAPQYALFDFTIDTGKAFCYFREKYNLGNAELKSIIDNIWEDGFITRLGHGKSGYEQLFITEEGKDFLGSK